MAIGTAKKPAKAKVQPESTEGMEDAELLADAPQKKSPQAGDARVKTGVPGLDELIGGGFEKGSTVVVMGSAGCGKTTMLSQFLYNGAIEYGDAGVMISFEEQPDAILRHMKGYGFDFAELERQGLFATVSYRPHEVKKLVDEGGGLILDTISSIGAKRLAVDSLTSYALLFETQYQAREAEITLFELLQKWKCTTLMSAEWLGEGKKSGAGSVEYLADGVIIMHHPRHKSLRYRAIEILKMRGAKQSEKLCPFELIDGFGVKVYPNEEIFYKLKEKE